MKFNELILHPKSQAELKALLKDPPQGLLLVAPSGMGKCAVATGWAEYLTNKALISILAPEDSGSISIDSIRNLYKITKTRQGDRQVVIIDQADAMSSESQNAFLKLLEEPRPNLTFILTVTSVKSVLPTITSRVQSIFLHPIASNEILQFAKKIAPNINEKKLAQALFIANGRPALLRAMLTNDDEFNKQSMAMAKAKDLLTSNKFAQLSAVTALVSDKTQLMTLLESMGRILELQIQTQPTDKLISFAEKLQTCLFRLQQNGNARAQLIYLFT